LLFLDYIISLAGFVAVWGILQFFANLGGYGSHFMLHYNAVRPEAFFSETTWYAIYLLLGAIIVAYRNHLQPDRRLFLLYPLFAVGFIFAANRNIYVAIALIFVLSFLYFVFLGSTVKTKSLRNPYIYVGICLLAAAIAWKWEAFYIYFNLIIAKFNILNDPSGAGRLEAFQRSLEDISHQALLGQGFTWYSYQATSTGTYFGAKSFNLVLMILYIFGFIGLIPFLLIIFHFYLRSGTAYVLSGLERYKYSAIMMTAFLGLSMFTPLHQYSIGMLFVAFGVYLARKTETTVA
jgi:hypothetical protein